MPGGRALDDTARIAPELVAAGVDCFRVSGGISDALVTMMVGRSDYGPAHNAAQAQAIKQVVDVPVMLVGRVHDPEVAEQLLREGKADLIAMARPLLADPQLPQKVSAGNAASIRRCISCEHCIDSMQMYDNLACAVNPLSGREYLATTPTVGAKKVLVIGSGAAGLEAARYAAQSGHRVVLVEQQQRLGGSLLLASAVHADNQRFLDWLLQEVKRLEITVRLGVCADEELVRNEAPDAVIVATGAAVHTPPIPGAESPGVLTGAYLRQLLQGTLHIDNAQRTNRWLRPLLPALAPLLQRAMAPSLLRVASQQWMPLGKRVVVIGADLAAIELAEFIARRGRDVCLFDDGKKLAPEVGKKRRHEHMDRLDQLNVAVNTGVEILRVEPSLVCYRTQTGAERKISADNVIVAGSPAPDTRLADALHRAGFTVYPIGDCSGLGLIAGATADAAAAVEQISGCRSESDRVAVSP
jgi:2,4-dienoyl-CoA reductase (NADPH2)